MSYCCKALKTDPSGEICTCATGSKPFYQMHTLTTYFCLLLLNLKMSVTISNMGFIWKYKDDMLENLKKMLLSIILKTLTWEDWSSVLKFCEKTGSFLVQTSVDARPGLRSQPPNEAVAFRSKLE